MPAGASVGVQYAFGDTMPSCSGLRDARLHAGRHDRPAVVLARLDQVQLVAARRTVLGLPQLVGDRIERQALRVAVAVAPDRADRARRLRTGCPSEPSHRR